MTDPLIDRDRLTKAIYRGFDSLENSSTDAVLDYLRSVLTPEALDPVESDVPRPGWVTHSTGADLHRRIFGEPPVERAGEPMTDPLIDRDALLDTPITARVECRVCGAVFYGGDFDQAYIVALGHLRQVHWGKPDD